MRNEEHWVTNKLENFLAILEKLLQALEMLQQVYKDNTKLCAHVFEGHKRFKEGWKKVKDDSRRRPSTSRSEVNIKQEKQVVRGNHWLTV